MAYDYPQLVAILRGVCPNEVISHTEVLLDCGFRMIEIPTNSPDWQQSLLLVQRHFQQQALFGAGTVVHQDQLNFLIEHQFPLMVTPTMRPALIRLAKQAGLTTCIGAFTPTEIFNAIEAGADIVKLFPAGILGINYIKAIRAILPPKQPLFAVGGVSPDNLALYLENGCQGAGLGGELYRAGQSVDTTRQNAQRYIASWNEVHQ